MTMKFLKGAILVISFILLTGYATGNAYAINQGSFTNPSSSTSCNFPCSGFSLSFSASSDVSGTGIITQHTSTNPNYQEIDSFTVTPGQTTTDTITVNFQQSGNNYFRLVVRDEEVYSITINAIAPSPTPSPAPTSVPPIPTTKTCNQTCGLSNEVCQSGLYCATVNGGKYCRLQAYQDRSDCSVPPASSGTSSPTATPTPSSTSSSGTSGVLSSQTSQTATVMGPENVTPTETPTPTPEDVLGANTNPGILNTVTSTIVDHIGYIVAAAGALLGVGALFLL